MAIYFSNLIGADGTTDTVIEVGKRPAPGQYGGQLKIARAFIIFTAATGDVLRFFTLPSGVRLHHIFFHCTALGTTVPVDLGLHVAGPAHDGVVIDADMFASALAAGSAIARTDEFLESAGPQFVEADRGKFLWQLADLGAGTYATDPFQDWDVTGTVGTVSAGVSGTVTLEVQYI
jgi:hypothetical protein